MKRIINSLSIVFLLLAGCKDHLVSSYTAVFPAVPEAWADILGQPHWRVEWLDQNGVNQRKDMEPGERLTINLPSTWANPVTAWPTWPLQNLPPGLFKPAGGLFPHDISGTRINLTWEAGYDTVFYRELINANGDNETKIPANFDWLRFRELFLSGELNDEICKDPWLADWRSIAEKTISSNFDRRRLVPEAALSIPIPVSAGPWYGTSPFSEPLIFKEDDLAVFPVRSGVNVWISTEGILKLNGNILILTEIRR